MVVCVIVVSFLILPVLINRSTRSPLHVQELWLIFTKTFCCGSHKCLYGEAGAAASIDTFKIGTGDSMPAGAKSHHT